MKWTPIGQRYHFCLAAIGKPHREGISSSLTFSKSRSLPVSDRQKNVNSTYLLQSRSFMNAIINHREGIVNYYHKTMACSFYSPRSILLKDFPVPGLSYRQATHITINI